MTRANEPAYPTMRNPEHKWPTGLTIREHFAAMAMQGLCANGPLAQATTNHPDGVGAVRKALAEASVCMADALLAELAKEPR